MVDLSTSIASLSLSNPAMLASGILGETGGSLLDVARSGAGAVVTKSISLQPRPGHPNPTVVEVEGGLINAMGLPNPGVEAFKEEMTLATEGEVPVIASVFGEDVDEYGEVARQMAEYGASAIELNLSCPHTKGLGIEFGTSPELVQEIVGVVKGRVSVPVFAKLSPNLTDIVAISQAAVDAGADGIVAVNTMRAMAIDVDLHRPILANKVGGLSGRALRPIGVRCVYEIASSVKVPIIACGGIESGRDSVEYLMAGASAFQVGTAFYSRGKDAISEILKELTGFLESRGYNNLEDIIGLALEP